MMPEGFRQVRPGLYERIDTPKDTPITIEFVQEFARQSGSPAFRDLIRWAREQSLAGRTEDSA
jgi:hypothetical protein